MTKIKCHKRGCESNNKLNCKEEKIELITGLFGMECDKYINELQKEEDNDE